MIPSSILNLFSMQGALFCRDRKAAGFIIRGLRHTNISLDVVSGQKSYRQDQIIFDSSVFVFHGALTKDEVSLVHLIQRVKPSSCLAMLDPTDMKYLDDFDLVLSRPYSFPYLSLLIQREIYRKRERSMKQRMRFGDMTLFLQKRLLMRGGKTVCLTNKEFALMQYFFLNPGRIVTRSDILDNIWDSSSPLSTNTVDVHVSRLRQKLSICRAKAFLRTVPCVGYQWISDAIS